MPLSIDRARAIRCLERDVIALLHAPLFFGVGKYNSGYQGNKTQMQLSKFLRKRKEDVNNSINNFKKIDKLCKIKSDFTIESLIESLVIYDREELKYKTFQALTELAEEVIRIFNETDT